jgi:AcrR family transcriptional regulator
LADASRTGPDGPGGDTGDAIKAAAVDLFAERGYHAASMRSIASAAGIRPAAIYHWFPAKEEILIQLQDEFMERLTEAVDAAVAAARTPALKLAAAVREHVVFHGLHPREAFVTDSEIRALSAGPRDSLIRSRDRYQEKFRTMIVAGIGSGELTTPDPSVATYAILLECTGVGLWFDPTGELSLDRVADLHVELVLASLRAADTLVEEATGRATAGSSV